MIDSSERIQYIADYLACYKQKIEMLNNNGLFDGAVLFELLSAETLALWFGQKFRNMNSTKAIKR